MNEVDDKIKQALRATDADLLGDLGEEPAMLEQVIDTFRTRNRWLVLLSMIMTLVFMVLAIFCLVRFFGTNVTQAMLKWLLGVVFSFHAVAMFKIWFWMELNKNSVTREIKRMELQLARMSQQGDRES